MPKEVKVYSAAHAITGVDYFQPFDFTRQNLTPTIEGVVGARVNAFEQPAQNFLQQDDRKAMADDLFHGKGVSVIATYIGGSNDRDISKWVAATKKELAEMKELFPELSFACLHPWGGKDAEIDVLDDMVKAHAEIAEYSRDELGISAGTHVHFNTSIQYKQRLKQYANRVEKRLDQGLRLILDTGHFHSAGGTRTDEYMEAMKAYKHLWSDYVHLKARLSTLDRADPNYNANADPTNPVGNEDYDPLSDPTNHENKSEGGTIAMGMVDPTTVGHETPFAQIFEFLKTLDFDRIIGTIELDSPLGHPTELYPDAVQYYSGFGVKPLPKHLIKS